MNYFIEGLQGSGKSTFAEKLARILPGYTAVKEGEYSPVELAWCAYVDEAEYQQILDKYSDIRNLIEEKTFAENEKKIICYTKVRTDNREFYRDLEQYEIYNNGVSFDEFRSVILSRYRRWTGNNSIFECSLFQNIIEDMILFRNVSDEEIVDFYKDIKEALEGREYRIVYLYSNDINGNLAVIRRERSDDQGNELWFPLMMSYFDGSPYAINRGLKGEKDLISHLEHRQQLELRICRELFPDSSTVIISKEYEIEHIEI